MRLRSLTPRRYRGAYVPPAGHGAGPDPFAPGPDSPYWVRLEMTDPEGRKTFHPRLIEVASQLRYEHRNLALGLDLRIDLDMHPQPFMTVNEKIYPVELDLSGWRLVAYVTADVGTREFENAWFAAFAGSDSCGRWASRVLRGAWFFCRVPCGRGRLRSVSDNRSPR